MQLTSKGRYAVAAIVDLAQHQGKMPTNLDSISKRQYISLSYLEQLFKKLRQAELVVSVRGPGGGYLLAQAASAISIAAIIHAVSESVAQDHTQQHSHGCEVANLWVALDNHMQQLLNSVTVQDVCDDKNHLKNLNLG